jgi:hypothetical protein
MPNVGGGVIVGSTGGGGIAPPAGDIGGTTAAPTVIGIQGKPIVGGPTTGDVLEYNGTDWVPVAPGGSTLTHAQGLLPANVGVTSSLATFMTTSALATGVWMIFCNGTMDVPPSNVELADFTVALGTAVGTFAPGPLGIEVGTGSASIAQQTAWGFSYSAIVTITTAGTLIFEVEGTNGNGTILANGQNDSAVPITGWYALKIG